MNERRTNRSTSPAEAIRLFLESILGRHGLEAVTLVNEDGLLIAGAACAACASLDLQWIGALGSVCVVGGRRGPSLSRLVERATAGRHLDAREIVLRGERLYLASVGGQLPTGPGVAMGIERILAQSLPAAA
jgi:hypothetical protein